MKIRMPQALTKNFVRFEINEIVTTGALIYGKSVFTLIKFLIRSFGKQGFSRGIIADEFFGL